MEENDEETGGEETAGSDAASTSARSVTAAKPKGASRPKGEVGQPPKKAPFDAKDAELLWPEILSKLPNMGHSPYELVVRVVRVDPPPREQVGKSFEASAIRGDGGGQIPGDALIAFVARHFHCPFHWSQGPCQYELQWCWKNTGHIFAHGTLRLPSRDVISAANSAEWQMREDQGRAGVSGPQMPPMPPPPPQQSGGFGQPPTSAPQQPVGQPQPPGPQWPYPGGAYGGYYPGMGAPPGYPPGYAQGYPQQPQAPAPPARDPEIDRMREEMSEIKALLRESITSRRDSELSEIKEMLKQREREGVAAPPAPQQPMQQPLPPREPPLSQDALIARAVVQALGALGMVPQQQQQQQQRPGGPGVVGVGVGNPAPVGHVAQAAAGLDALESLAGIFDRAKKLTRRLDGVMGRPEEEEEPPPPVETPAEQQPQMGVALVDVGTTWRDGRPVKAAVDPETGKFVFDQQGLMGIALGNPIIGEGILDVMQAIKNKVVAGAGRQGVGAADVHVRQVPPQAPELQAPTGEAHTEQPNGTARSPWVV